MTKNKPFDFNAIIGPAHQNSRDKGFWDDCRKRQPAPESLKMHFGIDAAVILDELDPAEVKGVLLQKLLLIMTEVGEAYDETRKSEDLSKLRFDWSRESICSEYWYVCPACKETLDANEAAQAACPYCRHKAKPIGYASELADILIRIADLYGAVGWRTDQDPYETDNREATFGELLIKLGVAARDLTMLAPANLVCSRLDFVIDYVIALADIDKIDIGAAVEAKMAYNLTRPVKHGKRF